MFINSFLVDKFIKIKKKKKENKKDNYLLFSHVS